MKTTYDTETGCELLARKGIKDIHLYGDSYQRHIFVGLALTLTGDYQHGALQADADDCDYNKQFDEKRCRMLLNLDNMTVCGGAVALHYKWGGLSQADLCEAERSKLVLWSIGNHILPNAEPGMDEERTKNNVERHVAWMEERFVCPYAAAHHSACHMWWITTHQRLNHHSHVKPTFGEDHTTIHRYNVGMREFFEAGRCGNVHVVDMFNMTNALVTEMPIEETLPLTYDSAHWGGVVNLIKVQILLNDMERVLPDGDAPHPARRNFSRRRALAAHP
ncbi:hypothetical protein WJX81_000764 [Elliptochloris bilobata]|uniref:Uncharacterized protein n=1 Tax=Elliptochloris bilobata TaxID=381761 RepID=A0AAW1RHX3_9CHLO